MQKWIALLLACLLLTGCASQTAPVEEAVVETQWPSSDAQIHTRRELPVTDAARAYAAKYPQVKFDHAAVDDITLYEVYLSGAKNAPMVIFLHEQGTHKDEFLEIAAPYAQAGYFCVLMDLPGHGERVTEEPIQAIEALVMASTDVELLLEYYRFSPLADVSRFAFFGISMGGSVAYHYTAWGRRTPSLLLVCGAAADFGMLNGQGSIQNGKEQPMTWDMDTYKAYCETHNPITKLDRLGAVPVFAVHGCQDKVVPQQLARDLEASLSSYGNARFLFVEQGGHEVTLYMLPHVGAMLNQYLK